MSKVTIVDSTNYNITVHTLDVLGKMIVNLSVERKTNIQIGTSYSTLLQLSSFPNTPIPTETHYSYTYQGVEVAFGSGGLSARVTTAKSTNFNVTFTYVVI